MIYIAPWSNKQKGYNVHHDRKTFPKKPSANIPSVITIQGRNDGDKRAQFLGRRITDWALKSPKMSQVLSSKQRICFRKTSGLNMEPQTCFFPGAPSNLLTPLLPTTSTRKGAFQLQFALYSAAQNVRMYVLQA